MPFFCLSIPYLSIRARLAALLVSGLEERGRPVYHLYLQLDSDAGAGMDDDGRVEGQFPLDFLLHRSGLLSYLLLCRNLA